MQKCKERLLISNMVKGCLKRTSRDRDSPFCFAVLFGKQSKNKIKLVKKEQFKWIRKEIRKLEAWEWKRTRGGIFIRSVFARFQVTVQHQMRVPSGPIKQQERAALSLALWGLLPAPLFHFPLHTLGRFCCFAFCAPFVPGNAEKLVKL